MWWAFCLPQIYNPAKLMNKNSNKDFEGVFVLVILFGGSLLLWNYAGNLFLNVQNVLYLLTGIILGVSFLSVAVQHFKEKAHIKHITNEKNKIQKLAITALEEEHSLKNDSL